MFKDRALHVQLIKKQKPNAFAEGVEPGTVSAREQAELEALNALVKDQVEHAALTIVTAVAAVKVINVVCDVIRITAVAKIQ